MRLLSTTALIFPLLIAGSSTAQKIPSGSHLSVRVDRAVSSRSAKVEDRVAASLDRPIIVDGEDLTSAGTAIRAQVFQVHRGDLFHPAGYLTLRLASVDIRGR
jgi:hypothetical protein